MNILFICDEYPPGPNGGIGSITRSLATELVRQGHSVCVAGLYSYEFGGKAYEEQDGVKIWRMYYGFRLGSSAFLYKLQRNLPASIKRICFAKKDFRNYCRFIENIVVQEQINIIEHPDWISYGYDLGLEDVRLPATKVPVLLKLHGSRTYFDATLGKAENLRQKNIDRQLMQRADSIVAVSKFTAQLNQQLFPDCPEIGVLYNGVPLQEFPQAERPGKIVIFAGSLVEKKGIFQLMKAWPAVLERIPDAQLIVLGKGDQGPLKALVPVDMRSSLHFLGHRSGEEVSTQMRSASVAALPSYSETFGLVAIEAMRSGCATIFTTRTCGPEIIEDEKEGLLVDPDDVTGISDKIVRLLLNTELRQRLAIAGHEKVRACFEISDCVRQHVRHYEVMISNFEKCT